MKERRKYSADFKMEAVARCKTHSIKQSSQELGIHPSVLQRWKKEHSDAFKPGTNNKPSYEELEKEILQLKKELGYVEEINRVLKKSTAIFSSTQLGGFK